MSASAKKVWDDVEEYLVKTRYAVKSKDDGVPLEHSYDDVIKRVVKWMEHRLTRGIENHQFSSYDNKLYEELPFDIFEVRAKAYKFIGDNFLEEIKKRLLGRVILPATPVLMNAGSPTDHPCYFSCFPLGDVSDTLINGDDGIIDTVNLMTKIYRSGGGAGAGVGKIRPENSLVDNGQGEASGPVSFLYIYDALTGRISQGGRRRGAFMGYCPISHKDWYKFATVKQDNRSLTNMNLSFTVTDEDIKADDFEKKMQVVAEGMWKSGEPGLVFIDNHKRVTPVPLEYEPWSMNPCVVGETPMLTIHGYKQIQEYVDTMIPVWNGETFTSVVPFLSGKSKPVLTIKLSNGFDLKVTKNHNFFLKNVDGPVKAKDLKAGDVLEPFKYPVITGTKGIDGGERAAYQLGMEYASGKRSANEIIDDACYTQHKVAFANGVIVGSTYEIIDEAFILHMPSAEHAKRAAMLAHCIGIGAQIKESDIIIPKFYFGMMKHIGIQVGDRNFDLAVFESNIPYPDITVTDVIDKNERADVFCATEPLHHRIVFNGVMTGQCAEYLSIPFTACNLISVNCAAVASKCNTLQEYLRELMVSAQYAALFGSFILFNTDGYPAYKIALKTLFHRPVGIGVTGFHEALIKFGFDYTNPDYELVKLHQALLNLGTEAASAMLADEVGVTAPCRVNKRLRYIKDTKELINKHRNNEKLVGPNLASDVYKVIELIRSTLKDHDGLFNCVTTVQAPTGSVSIFGRALSNGIEPFYAIPVVRRIRETADGDELEGWKEVVLEPYWLDDELLPAAKKQLAHNVSPETQLRVLEALQQFCHTAISKTVNVPYETTVDEIKALCMKAYKMGLKSFTVYRDGSRNIQVLDKKKTDKKQQTNKTEAANRNIDYTEKPLPDMLEARRFCVRGPAKYYVTVSSLNGKPVEVFLTSGKGGTTINSFTEAIGRLTSLILRSDQSKVEKVVHTLSGGDDGHIYTTNGMRFRSVPEALGGILDYCCSEKPRETTDNTCSNGANCGEETQPEQPETTGQMCPSCGKYTLVRDGSCRKCLNCLYSSC